MNKQIYVSCNTSPRGLCVRLGWFYDAQALVSIMARLIDWRPRSTRKVADILPATFPETSILTEPLGKNSFIFTAHFEPGQSLIDGIEETVIAFLNADAIVLHCKGFLVHQF